MAFNERTSVLPLPDYVSLVNFILRLHRMDNMCDDFDLRPHMAESYIFVKATSVPLWITGCDSKAEIAKQLHV